MQWLWICLSKWLLRKWNAAKILSWDCHAGYFQTLASFLTRICEAELAEKYKENMRAAG